MGIRRSRKPRRRVNFANLFAYLLVGILVLLAGSFLYDWYSFGRGHQAFLKGDCLSANRYFGRVVSGIQAGDPGNYAAMAKVEIAECQVYLGAIDLERKGQYSQALQAYLEFLESHPESGLSEAIRTRSTALFTLADPYDLVNELICTRTAALLEQRLVPQRELNLPELYLSCAHFYDQAQEEEKAYAAYVTFLSEYPDHKSGRDAEAGLLGNPLTCQKPELLSGSPLAVRPDFIPKVYYTCGLNFESAGDLDRAIPMFATFLNAFPEHRFAEQMMTALARATVAQTEAGVHETLAQPLRQGSAPANLAEVTILNGSPYPLRIAFYGPEARVAELEACTVCSQTANCPTGSPVGIFRLKPGNYQLVIQTNPQDAPMNWLGTWTLENTSKYIVCFRAR